jgi:ketopantoate reductase
MNAVVVNTTYSNESEFVASLKLEAVMGEIAMINGKVVRIGDVVGFQGTKNPLLLESVEGRGVVISAGNRRYELTIAPLR